MTYELGVVGGMGSLATNVFFQYLIDHTPACRDQDHINCVILNHASIPDRTEAILSGEVEPLLEAIKSDFRLLNALPLKAVAIPCNTSHYFFETFQSFSAHPIINMVEETVRAAQRAGAERIAVLATKGTITAGVYEAYARKAQLEMVAIDPEDVETLMRIIYAVKQQNVREFPELLTLIDKYAQQGEVILACTELSTIDIHGRHVIDALKVLGRESIRRCRESV